MRATINTFNGYVDWIARTFKLQKADYSREDEGEIRYHWCDGKGERYCTVIARDDVADEIVFADGRRLKARPSPLRPQR